MTDEESKIIDLCQVISHWASKRGQANAWQEKEQFKKYDLELKKRINELKEVIKDELARSEG